MAKGLSTRALREAEDEAILAELTQKPEEDTQEDTDEHRSPDNTNWEKRYSDLRSYSQKRENELRKELELKNRQLEANKKEIKFPKTKEEVEDWVANYPDVAAIVQTIAMSEVEKVRAEVEEEKERARKDRKQLELERAFQTLIRAHPDFLEIRDDPKFHEWIKVQRKWVQDALYSDDATADDAIDAVKLYKAELGINKKEKKDTRREDASNIDSRSKPDLKPNGRDESNMIRESEINKLSIKEYERRAEEIEKAYREGRVILDMTGASG